MRKSRVRDFAGFIWYDGFMLESKKMVLPILLILLSISACSTCSEEVVVPLLEKVPADATLALEITSIEEALKGFGLYIEQISRGPGRPLVKRLRAALETQAGVQMFKPKAWTAAGIHLKRGMVLFIRDDQKMIYLESTAPEKLEKALAKLMTRLDGATKKVSSEHHGVGVVTLGRPFGTEVVPVLHYAQVGKTFLIALGGDASLVGETISLAGNGFKGKGRWIDDPLVVRLTKKINQREIQMVGRSALAQKILGQETKELSSGAAIGLDWGPTGVQVDGFVDFKVKGIESLSQSAAVLEHARWVEDDGALIVLADAARPELFELLRSQPAFKEILASVKSRSLRETGLDIEAQVLEHLEGPVALALHLQDIATLYKRIEAGERQLRVLLDSLQVAVVAKTKDAEAMRKLLDTSYDALVARGISLRKRSIQVGKTLVEQFEPDKKAPRMGWGVVNNHYYYGAGFGRAEKIVRHLLNDESRGALKTLEQSVTANLAKASGSHVITLRFEVVAQALGLLLKETKIPAMAKLGLTQQADMILALLAGMDDIALSINSEPQTVVLKVRQRL